MNSNPHFFEYCDKIFTASCCQVGTTTDSCYQGLIQQDGAVRVYCADHTNHNDSLVLTNLIHFFISIQETHLASLQIGVHRHLKWILRA